MAVLICIDPGFSMMGWSVLDHPGPGEYRLVAAGVWETEKSDKKTAVGASSDNMRRARELSRDLSLAIAQYQPRVLCHESQSYPRDSSTAAKLGQCFGVIAAAAEAFDLPIVEIAPMSVKRAVVGLRTATKDEVIGAVEKVRGCENLGTLLKERKLARSKWNHAADSVAVGIAAGSSDVVRALRKG